MKQSPIREGTFALNIVDTGVEGFLGNSLDAIYSESGSE